jgi:RimJ/RimL family protein N-acetyltransferase
VKDAVLRTPITLNALGQPIGVALSGWTPPRRPARISLVGQQCRLEPVTSDRHAAQLFAAFDEVPNDSLWTYLPYGPFANLAEYSTWVDRAASGDDPLFFAVVDCQSDQALGIASYLRVDPANGSVEVGHIAYSPRLRQTRAATEAMFLLMRNAFALGYRRYEWKCDSLNARSRAAALRLGFSFEGIFRQATIYKGRNRDTAWYAAIDAEWPALRQAFETWLADDNFDHRGMQRTRLSDLTASALRHAAT